MASTRDEAKREALASIGVDHVLIDDGGLAAAVRRIVPDGVDAAVELIGTPTLRDTLQATRVHGVVCFTGMLSNQWIVPDFYPIDFIPRGVRLTSYTGGAADLPSSVLQEFLQAVSRASLAEPGKSGRMCFMGRWSEERVIGAAPDASSLAAARKLARSGPWSDTGSNDVLVWGKCQGSGKTPYQVSVDIAAPAYRCSCPSRKFPCKHALALLLLWARGETADVGAETADFAQEWATQRADRAAARGRRQAEQQTDPVAQAKRLADRLTLMDAGIADFARWLTDLVRTGLASARNQQYSWWDGVAGRLVDAQLPGLAEQVRAMGSDVHARADWADHLLLRTGRWWAMTKAWSKRDELTPTEFADLRVAVGWAMASAEVQSTEALPGPWLVLGAHRSDDGRLQQQRTWLRGPDGTVVVVLDFAAQGEALATPQLAGALLDVTVARYPGSAPQRAMFTSPIAPRGLVDSLGEGCSIAEALEMESAAVALSPWRERHPVLFAGVRVCPGEPGWLRDGSGDALPLVGAPVNSLLALTGSHPIHLFGELEDGSVRPLSVVVDGAVVTP